MKTFTVILSIFSILTGCSSVKKNEKYYQTIFCKDMNGKIEHRLKDRSRVDCLTNDYAIEVDWAKKWAEAAGQSLFYALMTNKQPAMALIVSPKDKRFIGRAEKLAKKFNIKIFIIERDYSFNENNNTNNYRSKIDE